MNTTLALLEFIYLFAAAGIEPRAQNSKHDCVAVYCGLPSAGPLCSCCMNKALCVSAYCIAPVRSRVAFLQLFIFYVMAMLSFTQHIFILIFWEALICKGY